MNVPLPRKIVQVLRIICPLLNGARVEWAVSGSLALSLHGLPVIAKDIDLQTDRVGTEQIAHLLAECLIYTPGMHLGVRLYLCCFRIQGLEVEAAGSLEFQSPDAGFSPASDFRQKRTRLSGPWHPGGFAGIFAGAVYPAKAPRPGCFD
jgi:hypothetical protein